MKTKLLLKKLISTAFVLVLTLVAATYQVCSNAGCDICSGSTCQSCDQDNSYFPQVNSTNLCEKCPTGCKKCFKSGTTSICSECSDSNKYPKTNSTDCLSCPTGCNGCQLINGKISCLACKSDYTRKSNGLHLDCEESSSKWWLWLLIALGILLLLGLLAWILMGLCSKKKKKHKTSEYNEYEMSQKNNGYQQNVSMDQSMMQGGRNGIDNDSFQQQGNRNNKPMNNNNGYTVTTTTTTQKVINNQHIQNPTRNTYNDTPNPNMMNNNMRGGTRQNLGVTQFTPTAQGARPMDPRMVKSQQIGYVNNADNRTTSTANRYQDGFTVEKVATTTASTNINNQGLSNTGDASGWGSIQYESNTNQNNQNQNGGQLEESYSPFW